MDMIDPMNSAVIDQIDRQIVQALELNPRIAFARLADVLGVSEQTVARRYRRLRRAGVVRVLGVIHPPALGQSDWMVRVQSRPDSTTRLADALARRPDIAWVSVSSGGSEVLCSLRARSQEQRDDLIFQRLPATAQVLGVAAFLVLHRFVPAPRDGLLDIGAQLTAEQLDALTPVRLSGPGPTPATTPVSLTAADEPLLAALAVDGRASYAELAVASGLTEGRVARRLGALLDSGAVYLDADVAIAFFGLRTTANLWLTAAPARLEAVGAALSRRPEVNFAAAITGPVNIAAAVSCADPEALYRFITRDVGAISGVEALEVSPLLRRVKQAGSMLRGDRLADPAPAPRPRRAANR